MRGVGDEGPQALFRSVALVEHRVECVPETARLSRRCVEAHPAAALAASDRLCGFGHLVDRAETEADHPPRRQREHDEDHEPGDDEREREPTLRVVHLRERDRDDGVVAARILDRKDTELRSALDTIGSERLLPSLGLLDGNARGVLDEGAEDDGPERAVTAESSQVQLGEQRLLVALPTDRSGELPHRRPVDDGAGGDEASIELIDEKAVLRSGDDSHRDRQRDEYERRAEQEAGAKAHGCSRRQ